MPKRVGDKTYVHRSAVNELGKKDQAKVGKLSRQWPEIPWTVARVGGGSVMLGKTTSFSHDHPKLLQSVTFNEWTGKTVTRKYARNHPIYHRIELMLPASSSRRKRAERVTASEEKKGLLSRSDIGRADQWEKVRGSMAKPRKQKVQGLPRQQIVKGQRIWRGRKGRYYEPLDFARGQGTTSRSKYFRPLIQAGKDAARERGIFVGKLIGQGTFAKVFEGGDLYVRGRGRIKTVVKITGDRTEAAAWAYIDQSGISKLALPALANTLGVFMIKEAVSSRDVFIILQERYYRLRGPDAEYLSAIETSISPFISRPLLSRPPSLPFGVTHPDVKRISLLLTLQELASNSLIPYDIHDENVMTNQSQSGWFITDLGVTQIPTSVPIEVLN